MRSLGVRNGISHAVRGKGGCILNSGLAILGAGKARGQAEREL
jgi:hypothetical protein